MDVKLELGPAGQDYDHIEPLDSKAGMSDLFRAHKKGLDVDVIIKRVRRSVQNEVDEQNEAEILKKVKHQYLPQIYDIIRGKDGYLYTVMDLIHGENLQDYVQAHGSITQQQAYLWGCQLCEAVEYLQEEKDQKPVIIHCDIKPSNVMITESGDICLIDFGISLISRSYVKASTYLTPGYAAPEQYYLAKLQAETGTPKPTEDLLQKTVLVPRSGLTAEDPERTVFVSSGRSAIKLQGNQPESDVKISKYTDIYAIGATLYFAVSGKRPESAIQEVTPLSKLKTAISDSMLAIIMRAMEKDPAKRFRNAAAMLDALHHVDQMDSTYRKFVGQKRMMTLVLSASFLLSVGSTVYGFYRMRAERENAYLNLISQAQEAGNSGHYKEGQELLETAIQQQPARADAYLDLAVLFYEQGEYQAAIDLLQNAALSGNLKIDGMDPIVQGELYYIQGSCLYELGEYEPAIDALQKAADSHSVWSEYRHNRTRIRAIDLQHASRRRPSIEACAKRVAHSEFHFETIVNGSGLGNRERIAFCLQIDSLALFAIAQNHDIIVRCAHIVGKRYFVYARFRHFHSEAYDTFLVDSRKQRIAATVAHCINLRTFAHCPFHAVGVHIVVRRSLCRSDSILLQQHVRLVLAY